MNGSSGIQSDEEIVALVQKGDAEAFGLLMERYEDKLMRYARRFLFTTDDSQDLVQEAFIKAYANIKSFDASRRFSPWLYRIAHNEFINTLKKKKNDPLPFFDPDTLFPHPIAPDRADQDINNKELKAMLDRSLNELDQKYREPLILYYFQELSYQEIADVLQIPTSTVGVRINRGKDALRKIISRKEESYEPRKSPVISER